MFHGREIAMTAAEKVVMRHKLLAYTLSNPPCVAGSGAFSWVRRHALVSSALAVLLALGGTGVSASMAGPNDALYDFRLQVNDRIESAMALNEDAQLDVELRQIERQLNAEVGAVDEVLAADEQNEAENVEDEDIETPKPENLNRNDKKSENNGNTLSEEKHDKNNTPQDDDELEKELRQMDRELQQEESAVIGLEV